jgi:hypothetical protein
MRVTSFLIVFVLGLFSGATTAQTSSVPVSVNCTSVGTELCTPLFNIPVTTSGVLNVSYTAAPTHCGPIFVHFFVDGVERVATSVLNPGQTSALLSLGPVSAGDHILGVQGEGVVGGCNIGFMTGWGGTVQITVSALTAAQPVPAPGIAITAAALLIAAFAFFRYRRA